MTLLVLHAAVTLFMLGVIFVIQLVHYPLMADIGEAEFNRYHASHMSRMGFVAVPMVLELGLAGYIAVVLPAGVTAWLGWIALGTLVIVWVSTFALQVPAHNRLAEERNEPDLRILVRTNWIRTAGWTVRSVLALVMVVEAANGEPEYQRHGMVSSQSDTLASINDLRGAKRVILVRPQGDGEIELAVLKDEAAEIDDRHIYWFVFTDGDFETNADVVISQNFVERTVAEFFREDHATVILIGKDGGVKQRDTDLRLDDLFALIDTMPMRRSEMNRD